VIVIDVGCAAYGGDQSIPYLIEEFKPTVLIGLDPAIGNQRLHQVDGTFVIELPMAAWTFDGTVGFTVAGLRGHIDPEGLIVECYDLAGLILDCSGYEIALKLDAEGAEWELLSHLIGRDVDRLLKLAWVEYHCDVCGRGGGKTLNHVKGCRADPLELEKRIVELESRMRCDMHRWNR
jgi:hypothetical protein